MNHSSVSRCYAHPGVWGHEDINSHQNLGAEQNLHSQLWVTLNTMSKRDDQWITVIGKAPRTLIAQLIASGVRPDRIRRVNTTSNEAALWATEQALLINNSQLVIAWLNPCAGREKQRLQLVAKASQAISFLFTPDNFPTAIH